MEQKFCINCEHYRSNGDCRAPEHGVDLVTGQPQVRRCAVQRSPGVVKGYCGEQALFFQPKVTA
jgi:hypothetical protein